MAKTTKKPAPKKPHVEKPAVETPAGYEHESGAEVYEDVPAGYES